MCGPGRSAGVEMLASQNGNFIYASEFWFETESVGLKGVNTLC